MAGLALLGIGAVPGHGHDITDELAAGAAPGTSYLFDTGCQNFIWLGLVFLKLEFNLATCWILQRLNGSDF